MNWEGPTTVTFWNIVLRLYSCTVLNYSTASSACAAAFGVHAASCRCCCSILFGARRASKRGRAGVRMATRGRGDWNFGSAQEYTVGGLRRGSEVGTTGVHSQVLPSPATTDKRIKLPHNSILIYYRYDIPKQTQLRFFSSCIATISE